MGEAVRVPDLDEIQIGLPDLLGGGARLDLEQLVILG
jgi:hypothetical protein